MSYRHNFLVTLYGRVRVTKLSDPHRITGHYSVETVISFLQNTDSSEKIMTSFVMPIKY